MTDIPAGKILRSLPLLKHCQCFNGTIFKRFCIYGKKLKAGPVVGLGKKHKHICFIHLIIIANMPLDAQYSSIVKYLQMI